MKDGGIRWWFGGDCDVGFRYIYKECNKQSPSERVVVVGWLWLQRVLLSSHTLSHSSQLPRTRSRSVASFRC
ncbi:hypothetical protein RIF29_24153 [Crotalaria pallida]|uniref:Uncharacterized protein n=1 Tax=Crotalaria pallida TaxID=3830 RepID=A0AAN9ERE9_CROPI